jgi:uncharacterized protein YbjT (DUF2867 family)
MGARYLVFGASGHIGGPLATELAALEGESALRLATSDVAKRTRLLSAYPDADVIVADYLDQDALVDALVGISAVFVVTPDFFDDRHGTEILLAACAQKGVRPHIVRVQAEIPGVALDDLAGLLAGPIGRRGHLEARQLIEASGLPATFLNIFGYYMDDLLIHFGGDLREHRTLRVPYDRPMCWIDPRDLGAAAARVMAGPPPGAPRLLHLNNGEDGILFSELARMLSELSGAPVAYDSDPQRFREQIGPLLLAMTGNADAAEYLLADWRMEREHAALYKGTPALSELLNRSPTRLSKWIYHYHHQLLC